MVPDYTNIHIPHKVLQAVVNRSNKPRRNQYITMLKVPPLLRQEKNNQQEYDPLVVSLGPYHHGKPELQLAEDLKINALEMVVADSGKDTMLFYNKVFDMVKNARNCYIDDSTDEYDDPTFAQMMLLDACFIISYVVVTRYVMNNREMLMNSREILMNSREMLMNGDLFSVNILRDLMLLENQIPLWLLKKLIVLGYGKENGEEMLDEFLNFSIFGEFKRSGIVSSDDPEEQPFHLLDAFRLLITPPEEMITPPDEMILDKLPNKFSRICINLVKNVTKFPCQRGKRGDEKYSMKNSIHSFGSASELKARGIHFRPSSGHSLKCIKLNPGILFATLEVPVWFVTMYTKGLFLNMIAYELFPRTCTYRITCTNRAITTYIAFMKILIDNPKDVKELREKKILLTTLGSDEAVEKVYKEINTYGLDNCTLYDNVKNQIQAHYNNKAKMWIAELLYTYFRSPWTVITLFAATFLLLLTFLQTYFTINPCNG